MNIKLDSVAASVQALAQDASLDRVTALTALKTIQIYFRNALKNPTNSKFTDVYKSNKAFQTRVGSHASAVALLKAVGFAEEHGQPTSTSEQVSGGGDSSAPEIYKFHVASNVKEQQLALALVESQVLISEACTEGKGIIQPLADRIPAQIRHPTASDLCYRQGTDPAPSLECLFDHTPQWKTSGVCSKPNCGHSNLVADDYVLCWKCKGAFCLSCVVSNAAIQAGAGQFAQETITKGYWAKCPNCSAELGLAALPFVFQMVQGAAVLKLSNQLSNSYPFLVLSVDTCNQLDMKVTLKRARDFATQGNNAAAIDCYNRIINTINYMRARVPSTFVIGSMKLYLECLTQIAQLQQQSSVVQTLAPYSVSLVTFAQSMEDMFIDEYDYEMADGCSGTVHNSQDSRTKLDVPPSGSAPWPMSEIQFITNNGVYAGYRSFTNQATANFTMSMTMQFVWLFETEMECMRFHEGTLSRRLETASNQLNTCHQLDHFLPKFGAGCQVSVCLIDMNQLKQDFDFGETNERNPAPYGEHSYHYSVSYNFACGRASTKLFFSFFGHYDSNASYDEMEQVFRTEVSSKVSQLAQTALRRLLLAQTTA